MHLDASWGRPGWGYWFEGKSGLFGLTALIRLVACALLPSCHRSITTILAFVKLSHLKDQEKIELLNNDGYWSYFRDLPDTIFLGKIKVDSQVFTFYYNHADSLFCQLIVQKAKQVLRHYFYIWKKKLINKQIFRTLYSPDYIRLKRVVCCKCSYD